MESTFSSAPRKEATKNERYALDYFVKKSRRSSSRTRKEIEMRQSSMMEIFGVDKDSPIITNKLVPQVVFNANSGGLGSNGGDRHQRVMKFIAMELNKGYPSKVLYDRYYSDARFRK